MFSCQQRLCYSVAINDVVALWTSSRRSRRIDPTGFELARREHTLDETKLASVIRLLSAAVPSVALKWAVRKTCLSHPLPLPDTYTDTRSRRAAGKKLHLRPGGFWNRGHEEAEALRGLPAPLVRRRRGRTARGRRPLLRCQAGQGVAHHGQREEVELQESPDVSAPVRTGRQVVREGAMTEKRKHVAKKGHWRVYGVKYPMDFEGQAFRPQGGRLGRTVGSGSTAGTRSRCTSGFIAWTTCGRSVGSSTPAPLAG